MDLSGAYNFHNTTVRIIQGAGMCPAPRAGGTPVRDRNQRTNEVFGGPPRREGGRGAAVDELHGGVGDGVLWRERTRRALQYGRRAQRLRALRLVFRTSVVHTEY